MARMGATQLENLLYHKLGISPSETAETNIIKSVIGEVVQDITRRFPWSFLEMKNTSKTLNAGDYQKALPPDFLHLISACLISADNVTYRLHPKKPAEFDAMQTDLDDTNRPYLRWVYYDDAGDPHIEVRPKSDVTYTLQVRYKKNLTSSYTVIPNLLVIFYGVMAIMAPADQMGYYKRLYESGLLEMWASDRPDLEDEPVWKINRQTEEFNIYMDGLN